MCIRDSIEDELGECNVVATGGLSPLIAPFAESIQHVEPWPVSYTHLTLPTSDLVEISVVAGSLKKKKPTMNQTVEEHTAGQLERAYPR